MPACPPFIQVVRASNEMQRDMFATHDSQSRRDGDLRGAIPETRTMHLTKEAGFHTSKVEHNTTKKGNRN
jgi:hypothetical protein